MNCYKELIERLKYYGTDYATGGNLGREIMGTDDVLLDAATAIETLLAEREAAGWISVEDKLPKSNGLYVCSFHRKKDIKLGGKPLFGILRYYYSSEKPHFQLDNFFAVTHWMPLSTPPDRLT